ncbi:MAG: chorismate synthase [Actinomycetota bacterium]|nr:chorismate synthase [Actinomycetota bacterium]
MRFFTSGESHGKGLIALIEGIPAGLPMAADFINLELRRRQGGYGRGGRMKIEADKAEIISGVRWGKTLGSPISLLIRNKDWENWQAAMSEALEFDGSVPPVTRPRPGHADLPGALKYAHKDIRNILERSSARETAARVALGAVAKRLLQELGIKTGSYVTSVAAVEARITPAHKKEDHLARLFQKAEKSLLRCPDAKATELMKQAIDRASAKGDTVGGTFTVFIAGVPAGLGSHVQWDRKLDGLYARALMSIQAIKAVSVGGGAELAGMKGSQVMDEIFYSGKEKSYFRNTNNMGGIEGGMTNGMPVILNASMKPIPTLKKPLRSVDISTRKAFAAAYERSDVCAVPAASVVAEAMSALVTAEALLEKTGGDSMAEVIRNYNAYRKQVQDF